MATSSQMKSLITSHAARDDDRFYATALQVAAKAARAGQSRYATELRDAINRAQTTAPAMAPVIELPHRSRPGLDLFECREPHTILADLTLSGPIRESLLNVIHEQAQRHRLAAYDLEPSRKLLLTGPPGTGKTSTAEALASELNRPFLTIKLEKLITRYMGETAAKLGTAFDLISEFDGVYLFDEVDALASERAASNDVGEMRRILNSFLRFIEDDRSNSIIIAATNHPQLLDSAFFRRFDEVLLYQKPTRTQALRILKDQLAAFDTTHVNFEGLAGLLPDLSQADLRSAARSAAKYAILYQHGAIRDEHLRRSLRAKRAYLYE